ncbi:hypothetical protein ES703_48818 [subsurface metagenome]
MKAPIYKYDEHYILFDEKGNILGSQRYANSFLRELKKQDRMHKVRIKIQPDLQIIYTSIGEALFYVRYVDSSFVVLPSLRKFCPDRTHPIFLDLLLKKFLPLGLIEYSFESKYPLPPSLDLGPKTSETGLKLQKFEEIYKAESLLMWKDYNTYIGDGENNFVWEKGGRKGTIRDHLINMIKKDNIPRDKV